MNNYITETVVNKVKALTEIKLENWRIKRAGNPEVATKYEMEDIMRFVMGQPKHIVQLLDEAIEDALKARKQYLEGEFKPKNK